jgi:hypothetical protein
VSKVEALMQMPVTLKANGHSEDIVLTGLDDDQSLHGFQFTSVVSFEEAFRAWRLILTSGMLKKIGL